MDYELTSNILLLGACIVCAVWTILIIVLLVALSKRNWTLLKRTLKYTLNSLVFLVAWMLIIELALIVRPVFYETKEASTIALKSWIERYQINDIYIAAIIIAILFVINLFFHFKVEKRVFNKDLLILTVFDIVALFVGIWLTGQSAYYGLIQEISRHFR